MENPGYPATPGLAAASARLGRSLDAQEAQQAADDAKRRIEAAAPAMLAALREIAARGREADPRTQYGGFDPDHAGDAVALAEWEAAEIARAAIAAATGER